MSFERWEKEALGKGALIREPDGSGRLELWAVDENNPPAMLELLESLGDAKELLGRANVFYIERDGCFQFSSPGSDDAGRDRDEVLAREVERLDSRLTYDGPWDGVFRA